MNPINHTGKTRKGFLLTAGFLLLMLPLLLVSVQQQQDSRQRASELSFKTLPPGSSLPSDEECAVKVRRAAWEPRPGNATANNANVYIQGYRLNGSELAQYGPGYEDKVTGNFTGTTDEIIQWAACKWGFDENTVRAQAAAESSWQQMLLGKCLGGQVQPDTNSCHSVGIMQVTSANIPPSHPGTWPYARISTAFNIDYTLAIRRACFEGKLSLPGVGYQAGDEWGCIGQWNTGAWHNAKAETYIAKVKKALANNVWNTYGAGPLPTFPLISVALPSLSPAPSNTNPTTVPTVQVSPTSPYVVPTFFCLAAPCPITPSIAPSVSTPPQPTVAPTAAPTAYITLAPSEEPSTRPSEPEPTAVQPSEEVTISPFPTEDPCAPTTSVAHSKHKSKHKDHNGGISNFMEMLLKFFMELINLLLKLIGNNQNPNPVPTPSITPTVPEDPIVTEDPLDPEPTEAEEEFPTVDPCAPTASPEPEPTSEQPLPSEPEASVPVNPTSNVTPGTPSTPIASTFPSGTTLPSQTTSPGAVSPTEDPCAPVASVAHSKKKKSKHKGHNGFITKFMRFIIEFFIRIFRMIGQTPTNPSPVPSPAPTLSDPGITDEPILTLEPSAPAIVTGDPSAEPTPCGGADTAVISGKVTTDSRYFTTLNIGVADTATLGQVRTHTVNDPYANRDYTYTFTNLHPDKTYLVSVSACRTINTQQVCSKPMEILSCSGAIDEQEIACKITGSGTADFAVKRALLPSGSPAPTTGVIPSNSPAPTGISGATPTVFFNLQRGR